MSLHFQALAAALSLAAAALVVAPGHAGAGTAAIEIWGCAVPGVEAGCIVLTDADGTKYDITPIKSMKCGDAPFDLARRSMISLTVKSAQTMSICQEGTPMQIDACAYTEDQCPQ